MASAGDVGTFDVNQVCQFLTDYGVPAKYIEKFHEEEVNGKALLLFQQSHFKEIFGMPYGLIIRLWTHLHNPSPVHENTEVTSIVNVPETPAQSDETAVEPNAAPAARSETADNIDNDAAVSSKHDKPQHCEPQTEESSGNPCENTGPSLLTKSKPGGAIQKKGTPKATATQNCADLLSKHLDTISFSVIDDPQVEAILCILRHYHAKSPGNVLQKQFCFLVLTKEESKNPTVVWNAICGDEKTWLSMLPKGIQEEFEVDEVGIHSKREERYVSLSDGKFAQSPISKTQMDDRECILIVEETLVRKGTMVYISVEKKQERYVQFSVGKGQFDASFDASNLKLGLKIATTKKRKRKILVTKGGHMDVLPKSDHGDETFPISAVDTSTVQISDNDDTLTSTGMTGKKVDGIFIPTVEQPREFDRQRSGFSYSQHSQLACTETGPIDLLQPVHEFKLCRFEQHKQPDMERVLNYFVHETLRFSCGCLNERTNGTIHFGIADGNPRQAEKFGCFSREIVGIPLAREHLDMFSDKLSEFIGKSFEKVYSTARQCIHPPVFVPVHNTDQQQLFVIEVDVVPAATFCKEVLFEVSLPIGKTLKPLTVFIRDGSSTPEVEGMDLELLIKRLPKLDRERQRKEIELEIRNADPVCFDQQSLHMKLKSLICFGKNKLNKDKSVYPILVLSPPSAGMAGMENLQFIKTFDWKVVIDFDEDGSVRNSVFGEDQPTSYSTFCAEDFQDDTTVKHLLDQPCWIWGNGSKIEKKQSLDYHEWRSSERNKSLTKVIQHLAEELPIKRVVVIFLLFSHSYKEMSVIFGEFCKQFKGPNQLVYVAPGENSSGFQSELSEQYLKEDQVFGRGVVGMPWSDLNESMQQFCSITRGKGLLLPSPYGSSIETRRELFNEDVLYPLGMRDCEEIRKLSANERQELASEEELRFYGGAPVTWENFWFTDNGFNHVRKRAEVEEILQKVTALLQKPPVEGRVFTFRLLHELGSGASTLSRHVLWTLSRTTRCRCCVVKQINDKTVDQLFWFRRYRCENNDDILPVVALVDNIDYSLFDNFLFTMVNKAQDVPRSKYPVIVFLQTRVCTILPTPQEADKGIVSVLGQHLNEDDIDWFEDKYAKMSENFINFEKYATENLISFMMMKENFDPNYGRSVAKRSFGNASEREQKLLKYLSLLCYFDPHPVFTAAFDSMMVSTEFWEKQYFRQWLPDLTPSTRVLLKEGDLSEHFGTGTAVAIVHPNIAKYILEIVGSPVGDIAIEFLATPLLKNEKSFPVNHLRNLTQVMLKHRRKFDYGDDEQTKFSPLIEKIVSESCVSDAFPCKEGLAKAKELLVLGLELFADPFIAQQLARLSYLHAKLYDDREKETRGVEFETCFKEALEYAERAIEMLPNSSFLLDTKGRIYQRKYQMLFTDIVKKNQLISIERVSLAIEMALQAINWFKKSQVANKQDGNQENQCGYLGELSAMTSLLHLFQCIPDFRSQEGLNRLCLYLTKESYIPDAVKDKWARFHDSIKQFERRFRDCMSYMREDSSVFKDQPSDSEQTTYEVIADYYVAYHEYFSITSSDLTVIHEEECTNEEKFRLHWQKIDRYLSGELFFNVFNIVRIPTKVKVTDCSVRTVLQDIKTLLECNLRHCPDAIQGKLKTIFGMITVSLALHSPYGMAYNSDSCPSKKVTEEYNAVYQLVQEYCMIESRLGSHCLYSYLFQVMFLWPRKDNEISQYTPEKYEESLKLLQKKFNSRRCYKSGPDVKQNLYPKFSYRQSTRISTTLFYLGKGSGLNVFVHINELPSVRTRKLSKTRKTDKARWGRQIKWSDHKVSARLRRLTGRREGPKSITTPNPFLEDDPLLVHYMDIQHKSFSREEVTFFLGFSWYGPVAFDVRSKAEEESFFFSQTPIREKTEDPPCDTSRLDSYKNYARDLHKINRKLDEVTRLEEADDLNNQQKLKVARKEQLLKDRDELLSKYPDVEMDLSD